MFTIDFTSRVPIYEQICNNVIRLASAGVFKSGDRLPPVRTVAKEIGVNPNTVAKAYRTLEIDGYIYCRQRNIYDRQADKRHGIQRYGSESIQRSHQKCRTVQRSPPTAY